MTQIGEPKRTIIVEPLEDPVPREVPHQPEKPLEPIPEPQTDPAGLPARPA